MIFPNISQHIFDGGAKFTWHTFVNHERSIGFEVLILRVEQQSKSVRRRLPVADTDLFSYRYDLRKGRGV